MSYDHYQQQHYQGGAYNNNNEYQDYNQQYSQPNHQPSYDEYSHDHSQYPPQSNSAQNFQNFYEEDPYRNEGKGGEYNEYPRSPNGSQSFQYPRSPNGTQTFQNSGYPHQTHYIDYNQPPPFLDEKNRGLSDPSFTKDEFAPPRPSFTHRPHRGSIAASMAAAGEIPKKEGLRMWRSDEHVGELTKGGKRRTCARFCCCFTILLLLLIVGIVLGFLLWVRPPSVKFNGVQAPSNGSEVETQTGGFILNFDLEISVANPNFFGANFQQVSAKAYYPTNKNVVLGGGSLDNVDIPAHSNNTIHFPFTVNYTTSEDPSLSILTDIATKCGFLGDSPSQITVDYTLTVKLKVVLFSISPSFSSSTSFNCPLSSSDIDGLLNGDLRRRDEEEL